MNDSLEKILKFIEKKRWKYEFPINSETLLQDDLKIYGDDAVEFIVDFGKEFSVDINQFNINNYFDAESDPIARSLIKLLTNKNRKKRLPITISDLENSIKTGYLEDEFIGKKG
jgi:acyl carrier protein